MISILQESLPNEYRGLGSSLGGFFGSLVGVGLGPTLVALFTDYVYADPDMVSYSIFTVMSGAVLAATVAIAHVARNTSSVQSG